MREEGLIIHGEPTDEVIRNVSDDIVELETSDQLRKDIDKNMNLLAQDRTVSGALEVVKRKLLEK